MSEQNLEVVAEVIAPAVEVAVDLANQPAPEVNPTSGLELGFKRVKKENQVLKQQMQQMQATIAQITAQPAPNLDDLTDDQKIDLAVQKRLSEHQQQQLQAQQQAEANAQALAKVKEFEAFTPDLFEVLKDAESMIVPNVTKEFLQSSEVGALMLYTLEKNEDQYETMMSLRHNPRALQKFLDKMESKLEAEVTARKAPAKAPINTPVGNPLPVKGNVSTASGGTTQTMADFRALKASGALKKMRL